MTKKEIVKLISEKLDETQLKTKEIVQMTFDAIVDTLVREGRIELRNFGVFEVKKRAERKARNPRTGERVDVPAKYVVTFKPGKTMEEKVFTDLADKVRRRLEEGDEKPSSVPAPPEPTSAPQSPTIPANTSPAPPEVTRPQMQPATASYATGTDG